MKQFFVAHAFRQTVVVLFVYFIPIETVFLVFIFKEAVLIVDDFPKGFEISHRCVFLHVFRDTG